MDDVLMVVSPADVSLPKGLSKHGAVLCMTLGTDQDSNYFTDAMKLRKGAGAGWDERCLDLLHVVCALRAADRYYQSHGLFQCVRHLQLAVGVADATHWRKVGRLLQRSVADLSDDQLSFSPLPLSRAAVKRLPRKPIAAGDDDGCDSTCLFSGGADSFCGAAHLLAEGRSPRVVGHSIGGISKRQKELHLDLTEAFPHWPKTSLFQVRAYPRTQKGLDSKRLVWQSRDTLHRLRSIYFLAVAAIVAKGRNASDVFMCENGVVGSAISFGAAEENPFTTRPAEPNFLRGIETFLAAALEHPIRIRNPFQYCTKGEVLGHAVDSGLEQAIFKTVSCWRSGNQGIQNCGECVPCMFRQLAFAEAGLTKTPRRFGYEKPIPSGARWASGGHPLRDRLNRLRTYCKQAAKKNGLYWILGTEPRVVDAVDVTGGDTVGPVVDRAELDTAAPKKTAEMIRRFAKAVLKRLK